MRLLFFPAAECKILDTWHSIGLRGTGSHDYTVTNAFVPAVLAAVPFGIARHAIDILVQLAETKTTTRSPQPLREDATMQANLGHAEALLRSGRAFLYDALGEAWNIISAGNVLSPAQRATLWLASTHAANTAKEAAGLMFSVGGSASPYTNSGLERCARDIYAAAQHHLMALGNYQMAGQAFLGFDMRATLLMSRDDRETG